MRAELNGDAVDRSELEEGSGQDRQLVDVEEDSLLRAETGQRMPDGREPLEGLHTPAGEPVSDDPLAPWKEMAGQPAEEAPELLASDQSWFARSAEVSDEYRENRDVAMGLPMNRNARKHGHDTQERQGMSEFREHSRETKDTSRQHISGAPLMRGMEADIDFADSDEMRLFLEEAGQTLKATVEGLWLCIRARIPATGPCAPACSRLRTIRCAWVMTMRAPCRPCLPPSAARCTCLPRPLFAKAWRA